MTKKNYIKFAEFFALAYVNAEITNMVIVKRFAEEILQPDNPNFNYDRFLKAVNDYIVKTL